MAGQKDESGDVAPGKLDDATAKRPGGYLVGYALALALTFASFWVASSPEAIWGPGVPIALAMLAIAQMGIHLVFFLHLTTAPDNVNNAMALAFGVLIVMLVVIGTLWIMTHLDSNMMPTTEMIMKNLP